MAVKDLIPIIISVVALFLSLLSIGTDTRGLSTVVRGASLDPDSRILEVHLSLINTGTNDMLFFAPDVSATERPEDAMCPVEGITSGIHATRLDDSITIEAGSISDHTLRFTLQSMRQGAWTVCVDGLIADFLGASQEVRFKAIGFRAIQENEKWEIVPDPVDTSPISLLDRELRVRSLPELF